MTNQLTNNEWIEKARKDFKNLANNYQYPVDYHNFMKSIKNNLPKPTEVVAPVDIEDIIEKIGYIKRYSDTRYFDWEEVKKELKKLIIDNLPQSISREAVEKLINRYKRLEEGEKDNIWGCALRCFIKDLNSLLLNRR